MSTTLNLTLKKKYFNQILSGEKTEEYREVKSYWIKRLTNQNDDGTINGNSFYKEFSLVKFTNGYGRNAPSFTIELKGIEIQTIRHEIYNFDEVGVFSIRLGRIVP